MSAVLEVFDLVVESAPSAPFSVQVAQAEIVGLLLPQGRSRAPILRALAGFDKPAAGRVHIPPRRRVVLASSGSTLSRALSEQPDLVLFDADAERTDRNTWARVASERALGTSFVVATSSVEQACRGDRVSLVAWDRGELWGAISELGLRMTSLVQEFLAVAEESRHRGGSASLAADLRRLNMGARAVLDEMRRQARAKEEWLEFRSAAAQVASASIQDRVLDAVIAEEEGR